MIMKELYNHLPLKEKQRQVTQTMELKQERELDLKNVNSALMVNSSFWRRFIR